MKNLKFFLLSVFVVSFSVCTAQQNQQQDVKPTQTLMPSVMETKANEAKPSEQAAKTTEVKPNEQAANPTEAIPQTASITANKTDTAQQIVPTQGVPIVNTQNTVQPMPVDTKQNASKTEIDNKVATEKAAEAVTQKTPEQVAPTTQTMTNETKPAETAGKPTSDPKADTKDKSEDVTPKHEMVKSTESPEAKQVLATRAFDGASFVGGIVLTLGLLAISFVGFKYYKNLTKENYHIL